MKRRYKIGAALLVSPILLWVFLGALGAGAIILVPKQREVVTPETIADVPVESVTFDTEDGVTISAWHPRNSDERLDLVAAYDFARDLGYTTIAAHGFSLGAATIIIASGEDLDFEFVVLESSFDTVDNMIGNREEMFGLPRGISWPLRAAAPWISGVPESNINVIDYAPNVTVPALLVAGDSEAEIKVEESRGLFEALGSKRKAIHIVKDGRHHMFVNRFRDKYEQVLDEFLNTHVHARAADSGVTRLGSSPSPRVRYCDWKPTVRAGRIPPWQKRPAPTRHTPTPSAGNNPARMAARPSPCCGPRWRSGQETTPPGVRRSTNCATLHCADST